MPNPDIPNNGDTKDLLPSPSAKVYTLVHSQQEASPMGAENASFHGGIGPYTVSCGTDRGRRRFNQDAFEWTELTLSTPGTEAPTYAQVLSLLDGAGGHFGGELAAAIASSVFHAETIKNPNVESVRANMLAAHNAVRSVKDAIHGAVVKTIEDTMLGLNEEAIAHLFTVDQSKTGFHPKLTSVYNIAAAMITQSRDLKVRELPEDSDDHAQIVQRLTKNYPNLVDRGKQYLKNIYEQVIPYIFEQIELTRADFEAQLKGPHREIILEHIDNYLTLQTEANGVSEEEYFASLVNPLEGNTLDGMCAAGVALIQIEDHVSIQHSGDVRAYVFRAKKGEVHRCTTDNTAGAYIRQYPCPAVDLVDEKDKYDPYDPAAVEDAAKKYDHVLMGAVGSNDPGLRSVDVVLEPGDRLVLSCDGAHEFIDEEELKQILQNATSVEKAQRQLIEASLRNDTTDNTTVIVTQYSPEPEAV
ncbi:MAG: hypothetical protein ACE5DX_00650 [Candidatus Dojkabacteria bacterium]